MGVTFEFGGSRYTVPEPLATTLAEKLRLLASGEFPEDVARVTRLGARNGWLQGARPAADLIEDGLVGNVTGSLRLEGETAEATHWALRLTELSPDPAGAAGLRDALEAARGQ